MLCDCETFAPQFELADLLPAAVAGPVFVATRLTATRTARLVFAKFLLTLPKGLRFGDTFRRAVWAVVSKPFESFPLTLCFMGGAR